MVGRIRATSGNFESHGEPSQQHSGTQEQYFSLSFLSLSENYSHSEFSKVYISLFLSLLLHHHHHCCCCQRQHWRHCDHDNDIQQNYELTKKRMIGRTTPHIYQHTNIYQNIPSHYQHIPSYYQHIPTYMPSSRLSY